MGLFSKPKQPKGQWREQEHLFRASEFVCSVCGCVAEQPTDFCPNCGSRMERPFTVEEMFFIDEVLGDD